MRTAGVAAASLLLGLSVVGVALVVRHDESNDLGPTGDGPAARSLGEPPARAFTDDSWWNTPLPRRTPGNPYGSRILRYLRTAPESGRGCLVLAGAGHSPWGQPMYQARPGDKAYDVRLPGHLRLPELRHLRIPAGAQSAGNSDGSMTVYDIRRGYVVMLTDAAYDADTRQWRASGATVTYLDSNGLDRRTGQSDDPRNFGSHRGNNGATAGVSYAEVHDGALRHVVKVAVGPEVAHRYVFPMVGSDGDYHGNDPAVPPQGLRLRLRYSVDLSGLDRQARVIAHGLQRYGFYIGDSGGTTALKLENTVAEGRGQLWDLPADALCGMPFTPRFWQVLPEGYDPTRPGGAR
jgi:hypothetical protein